MFRFDSIESEKGIYENQLIYLIIKNMNCFQEEKMFTEDQNNAVFITAEGRKGEGQGGVCLLKKELKDVQEDVREFVTTLSPRGYVWECSDVYFEALSKKSDLEASALDRISQCFYRGLYEELAKFGRLKGVGFLIMKLDSEVYISTKTFGLWPYVVELKPKNSPDKLFHGILPLVGREYVAYQEACESIERSSIKK